MLPIDPVPAGLAGAAATTAIELVKEASSHGWRWWQFRKRFSAAHKQGRILYLEVVGNLLLCRLGKRAHPPILLVGRAEWARSTTPDVLSQLLTAQELGVVAAPYLMHDSYGQLLGLPWTELLGVRMGGQDVAAVELLGDHFAEAERVLRGKLYAKTPIVFAAAIAADRPRPTVGDIVRGGFGQAAPHYIGRY